MSHCTETTDSLTGIFLMLHALLHDLEHSLGKHFLDVTKLRILVLIISSANLVLRTFLGFNITKLRVLVLVL